MSPGFCIIDRVAVAAVAPPVFRPATGDDWGGRATCLPEGFPAAADALVCGLVPATKTSPPRPSIRSSCEGPPSEATVPAPPAPATLVRAPGPACPAALAGAVAGACPAQAAMMAAMSGTGGGTGAAGSSTGRGGSSSGGGLMRRSAHRASPSASAPGASRSRIRRRAPALLMGRLPEPHLGECTQEGQPSSQGQASMTAAQTSSSSRAWPKA